MMMMMITMIIMMVKNNYEGLNNKQTKELTQPCIDGRLSTRRVLDGTQPVRKVNAMQMRGNPTLTSLEASEPYHLHQKLGVKVSAVIKLACVVKKSIRDNYNVGHTFVLFTITTYRIYLHPVFPFSDRLVMSTSLAN